MFRNARIFEATYLGRQTTGAPANIRFNSARLRRDKQLAGGYLNLLDICTSKIIKSGACQSSSPLV